MERAEKVHTISSIDIPDLKVFLTIRPDGEKKMSGKSKGDGLAGLSNH